MKRASRLEWNGVVRCTWARGCRGKIGRIGRNVGLRGEAVAVAAVVTATAEELDGVGHDLDSRALARAVAGVPLAPLKPAVDGDRAALLEVGRAVLALLAPDRDVEVVRLVDPLAGSVLAARVDGDPQLADGRPAGDGAELRVAREVPGENHDVDVRCCHWYGSLTVRGRSLFAPARLPTEWATTHRI